MIETRIYKGSRTIIPATIRKALNVDDDCIVQWNLNKEKQIVEVSFRKKHDLHDLSGLVKLDEVTNAVDLKYEHSKR